MFVYMYIYWYIYICIFIYIYIYICVTYQPSSLRCYFWDNSVFRECTRGGRNEFDENWTLKLDKLVCGTRKCIPTWCQSILGRWILGSPEYEDLGMDGSTHQVRNNISKKFNNIHLGEVNLSNQPSSLGWYFWQTYYFRMIFVNILEIGDREYQSI